MIRTLSTSALAAAVVLGATGGAVAQYAYPPGYAAYGWGGWGGGQTIAGSQAQGLGVLAAGAGAYNEQTAVARNINAQTAAQWNQYMYLSSLEAGQRHRMSQAKQRALINETADTIEKRLRDNPTDADIARGDALNVALEDITGPKVYTQALKLARVRLPGATIRKIPFNYAAEALTTSVDDVIKKGPPPLLKQPEFAADLEAFRAVGPKLRAQAESGQPVDPALIAEAQRIIKATDAKIQADPARYKKSTPPVDAARNYLKGLYGLVTMLQTPAIDVLLSGVENRPDTTLGDLLAFMHAFNLRFGPAKTGEQRAIYLQLYPMLDRLRDEVVASGVPPVDPNARAGMAPAEFFSGMEYQHLDAQRTPPAPAPAPRP